MIQSFHLFIVNVTLHLLPTIEKVILSWIFFIYNVISYNGFKGISVTKEGSPCNQIILPLTTFPIFIKLCWLQFHVNL